MIQSRMGPPLLILFTIPFVLIFGIPWNPSSADVPFLSKSVLVDPQYGSNVNSNLPRIDPGDKFYWIDKSCFDKAPKFGDYVKQALKLADGAASRVEDDSNDDFARVFRTLLKVDKNNPRTYSMPPDHKKVWGERPPGTAKEIALDVLKSLGRDWKNITSRDTSNLRIYCNDGVHLENLGDMLIDPINYIEVDGNWCLPEVATATITTTGAATTSTTVTTAAVDAMAWVGNQQLVPELQAELGVPGPQLRSVMIFCDRFFEAFKNPPQIPNPINMTLHDTKSRLQDLSLNTFGVSRFQMTLDVQLLHEWLHTGHYGFDDHPPPSGVTGGWTHILNMKTSDAIVDPEFYAWLGVWGYLAKWRPSGETTGRWTMDRRLDGWSRAKKANPEGALMTSKIAMGYANVFKRSEDQD